MWRLTSTQNKKKLKIKLTIVLTNRLERSEEDDDVVSVWDEDEVAEVLHGAFVVPIVDAHRQDIER